MSELVLRIGFSLLIVLALMWGLAKVTRRPLTGNRGTGSLAVLTRQQLSRASSVAVVQVADKAYVLGVTDAQVSLLGETDLAAFERHPHPHLHLPHLPHLPHGADRRDTLPIGPDGVVLDDSPPLSPLPEHHDPLAGSALSPNTWRSALNFLRERTARH